MDIKRDCFKKKTKQLVILLRQMHVGDAFMLISENDVPQLSKDALVVGESQLPVCFLPRFLLSVFPFCLPSFPHSVTGQGMG